MADQSTHQKHYTAKPPHTANFKSLTQNHTPETELAQNIKTQPENQFSEHHNPR
jgi:hypothetical protein